MERKPEEQTEYVHTVTRKVTNSGYISYANQIYFISKTLAGKYVTVKIIDERLVIDTQIPLHKEYNLKG